MIAVLKGIFDPEPLDQSSGLGGRGDGGNR
jgi:hypothetical protein